jgi:hypothetical protein
MACFAVPFFKHLISEIFLFQLLTFISWSSYYCEEENNIDVALSFCLRDYLLFLQAYTFGARFTRLSRVLIFFTAIKILSKNMLIRNKNLLEKIAMIKIRVLFRASNKFC